MSLKSDVTPTDWGMDSVSPEILIRRQQTFAAVVEAMGTKGARVRSAFEQVAGNPVTFVSFVRQVEAFATHTPADEIPVLTRDDILRDPYCLDPEQGWGRLAECVNLLNGPQGH